MIFKKRVWNWHKMENRKYHERRSLTLMQHARVVKDETNKSNLQQVHTFLLTHQMPCSWLITMHNPIQRRNRHWKRRTTCWIKWLTRWKLRLQIHANMWWTAKDTDTFGLKEGNGLVFGCPFWMPSLASTFVQRPNPWCPCWYWRKQEGCASPPPRIRSDEEDEALS